MVLHLLRGLGHRGEIRSLSYLGVNRFYQLSRGLRMLEVLRVTACPPAETQ